ncbi:hypothetical protein [Streptacidiphilus rugosus]|uniref:hypothetical protein n=1 Tax=Streptacidiphilus rugosus TaxID=405783 RepID=UPI0005653B4D|nr:hypothetical protein [Streptacidiphilus rugosus]
MTRPATELEFVGTLDDYWSYTKVRDWILLHPDLGRTALHLYLLLRSMLSEKRSTSLRRMSVDQLCWLLPGINGKPISKRTVEEALRELNQLGLVTNPDRERLVTSTGRNGITNSLRRYQVNDLPTDPYQGWRNTWDKLDAYHPDWRADPPVAPTHGIRPAVEPRKNAVRTNRSSDDAVEPQFSARAARKTASRPQKSARPEQKKSSGAPLTSENAAPKEGFPRSSSLAARAGGRGSRIEPAEHSGRENAAPAETASVEAVAAARLIAEAWSDGVRQGGGARMPRRQAALQEQAADLLQAGEEDVDWLVARARWMGHRKPTWSRFEDALTFEGDGAPPRTAVTAARLPAPRCGHCDDGWRYQDPENALGPYRCPDCASR